MYEFKNGYGFKNAYGNKLFEKATLSHEDLLRKIMKSS